MKTPLIINKDPVKLLMDTHVKERPALDLAYQHFNHRIKDLRVIGSWLCIGKREPCLVIVEVNIPLPRTHPCVVPIGTMWEWAEEVEDQVKVAFMAIGFCEALSNKSPHNDDDIMQVIDTVRKRLHDLKQMPVAPLRDRKIAGHITVRQDGEIQTQRDIWDDV